MFSMLDIASGEKPDQGGETKRCRYPVNFSTATTNAGSSWVIAP
jgi:hypothetical protein